VSEPPALPSSLERARHVDLSGRGNDPWARRVVMTLLAAVSVLALANVFGQDPHTSAARSGAATLEVHAPTALRGGLFYQGRIEVTAYRRIDHPRLVLGPGWTEQMQINTIEPAPTSETSDARSLRLEYDRLSPGQHLTVWLQLEVNPANSSGRLDQSVTLLDGTRSVAGVRRRLTVWP
jgi:hypothetical protein